MRRPAPRDVAWRLALTVAGAYALAIVLLGGVVFWATHAIVARQLDAAIRESVTALAAEYRVEGEAGLANAIRGRESRSGDPFGYGVFDRHGHRVAGALETPRPPVGWSQIVFDDPQEGPDSARAFALDLAPDRRLVVAADAEPLERIDQAILMLFAVALLIVLALGALGVLLVGTFLRRRLGPIVDTADAIVGGALDRRVPLFGTGDEFDRVAGSLNLMLERIAALVANLRQVSGDLAHDLRTPLTRMRAEFESVLATPTPTAPAAYRQTLARAIEQVDDVLSIFEATLRIAEIEEGAARSRFTRLDLSALTREVVEALIPAAEDSGHHLSLVAEPGQWVQGDRQLPAQGLLNLIGNALRHTPPETPVAVRVAPPALRDGASGPCLSVADHGPGIPEADRRRVLDRFVRLESARHTPGHGLGLSIVKAICDLHGVRLRLDGNDPGLRCRLDFPPAP